MINIYDKNLSLSCYIGLLLRDIRYEKGLSGNKLACAINISQQQISRYERGVSCIQVDMLFRFFSGLHMTELEMHKFLYKVIIKASIMQQQNILKF